ncbi:MAG: hypothetical protein WDW36_010181 [Sanguina aurantia]
MAKRDHGNTTRANDMPAAATQRQPIGGAWWAPPPQHRHTRDMACTPAPTRDGQLGKQVEVSTCGIPEAPQEMHQKRDVNTGRPPRGGSGGGVDPAPGGPTRQAGNIPGEGATGRGQEAFSQGLQEHPGVDDPSTAPGSTSGPVHKHHNRGASAARPGALHGAARGDVTWLPVSGPQAWLWATVSGMASSDLHRAAMHRWLQHTWSRSRNGVAAGPSIGWTGEGGVAGCMHMHMPTCPILPYPVPHPPVPALRGRWPVPAASHPCGVHSSSPAVAAACLSLAGLLPVSAAPECVNMWWRPKVACSCHAPTTSLRPASTAFLPTPSVTRSTHAPH